jgi:predicted permease
MSSLWRDLRFTLRTLGKTPGFVAIAIVTLALGIGANSTIFTWINATLLHPIPGLTHTSQVVAATRNRNNPLSYPDFQDLRDRAKSFSGMTAFTLFPLSLTGQGKPERVWGTLVTANYFLVLGVKPVLGRGFLPSEDQVTNGAPVAVISYRLWQTRFGGDRAILGRTIQIDTHPFTIVGVTPPIFQGSTSGLRSEIWLPLTMVGEVGQVESEILAERSSLWLSVLGRLRPGVGRREAQAELNTLYGQLARQYPDAHRGENHIQLYPLWRAPNGANEFFSQLLPILMALAGAVLLLACANLANLLLARGVARQREMAIRLALGAGRGPVVRQVLLESLLLSLAGGLAALGVTLWASRGFMHFAPASNLPIWISVKVDGRVLLATLMISVIAAALFGMLPALRAAGIQPASVLKDDAGSVAGGRRRGRLSDALAVAQIALSLVLLVAAGLFIRSFRAAQQFNPGFESHHVLAASYDLFPSGYKEADGIAFDRQVLERVRALPGVRAASLADWVPLGFGTRFVSFLPEGYVPGKHEAVNAGVANVSPGYFSTLRIPLVSGRDFSEADGADSAPVAIINETLAERYWPGRDAVGKRLHVYGKWTRIVGVARTTNYSQLNEPPAPFLYLPLYQHYPSEVTLQVRTEGDPRAAAGAVTRAVHGLNADLPIFEVSTLEARMEPATFVQRMAGSFVGVFGVLALVLAAVGLYGVVSYGARQRTREIGIRKAMGAQPEDIWQMVLAHGARLALVGVLIGLAVSFGTTRLLRSLLFGVGASDPLTFVMVTALLIVVALAASYLPARRAMKVDPIEALRHQ